MATTTVLLREDIDNLGGRGEIVKVKAGYARNYLLPRNLATLATKGNIKQVEGERAALLRKAATEKATADAQAQQMGGITLTFERKAGEHGVLFGSVTSMDIAQALQAKGYEIDRRQINLPGQTAPRSHFEPAGRRNPGGRRSRARRRSEDRNRRNLRRFSGKRPGSDRSLVFIEKINRRRFFVRRRSFEYYLRLQGRNLAVFFFHQNLKFQFSVVKVRAPDY